MRLLPIIFLSLLGLDSFAQGIHEIKSDLFLPFFKTAHLAYEYSPNGRFGFEAGMFFTSAKVFLHISPENYNPSIHCDCAGEARYPRQYLGLIQLAGRYYFSKKQYGAGLYGGIYLSKAFQIWRDESYDQLYFERNDVPVEDYRPRHFGIGLMAGYKWLFFKKRILLEPNVGLDIDPRQYNVPLGWNDHSRVGFIPALKLGFRFP